MAITTANITKVVKVTDTEILVITGTQNLSGYAPLASPTFTGTVVLPSTTSIGSVSATEIGYLDGVTSAVQTQLDAKLTAATAASTYLAKSANLSDLTSASTARTNLGLGSLATQSGTFSGTSSGTNTGDQNLSGLLVKASNLSDLTSVSTARTNLGLGSLATQSGTFSGTFSGTSSGTNTGDQDLSGYLTKAGNLSGLVSTSTARTNLGLGTAATRNVGQAAGNVLELSAAGTVPIGSETVSGVIRIGDAIAGLFTQLTSEDSTLLFEGSPLARTSDLAGPSLGSITTHVTGGQVSAFSNFQLGINSTLIYGASVNGVTLTCPDTSGTLALLSQVGDRYLTSSTTSNTIGNGAKTFTVGTGLAYTPTQDITIVNDAAHHMHAAVTTYNSTTGALVVDVNSHTGTGTFTSWTVNVGGIGAGAIPSAGTTGQVLAKVSNTNYDDAWVTPTVAVGGVTGLGTGVATALAVNVGSAGAPVVNGGAGGTPSSITLTNATGYPSATTTTAGTVPTLGATGSTVTGAPTRRQLLVAITNQFAYRILGAMYTSAASSGTGTASASDVYGNIRLTGTTSAGARNIVPPGSPVWGVWNGNFNVVDWGQSLVASGFMDVYHTGTPANDTRIRCGVGKTAPAIGQIANRGFMVEIQWNGTNYEIFCGVHNGTTLNLQTTGITFATSRGVLWSLEADGAGNAQWYVSAGGSAAPYNGQARTTITLSQTGAPTGTEAANRYAFIEINNGAAGGAALTVDFQPMSYAFGI